MKKSTLYDWAVGRIPVLGIAAVVGGFLLQFTMGTFYSFGNMMPYMVSYMRANGSPNLTYSDFVVVQSTWGMTQGVVMPLSGFLIELIGPKASMTAGATIFRYSEPRVLCHVSTTTREQITYTSKVLYTSQHSTVFDI